MPQDETNQTDPSIFNDGDDLVAAYEQAEEARLAVKLLTNQGFAAEQLYVLCSDKTRQEEFRSRLMPAGAPQLNTATTVVGGAGAAIGGVTMGGIGLTAGPAAAVAGAAAGAAAGAGVGAMLGAGTNSDNATNRLIQRHAPRLEDGKILVVVRFSGEGSTSDDRGKAEQLLATARGGME